MTVEDNILRYLDKVQELRRIEQEINDALPPQLWTRYHNLQLELESDKSVIQKEIKDVGKSVEVGGCLFKISTRTKVTVSPDLLETARDLGHLNTLVDMGVITKVTVNEDQINRLDPDLAAIYSGFVQEEPTTVLTWPKKADK